MRSASDSLRVGDAAPQFELESARGGRVSLAAFRGGAVALYFFRGTW